MSFLTSNIPINSSPTSEKRHCDPPPEARKTRWFSKFLPPNYPHLVASQIIREDRYYPPILVRGTEKNIIGSEQAISRKNWCTTDLITYGPTLYLIKIDHDIKRSFKEKKTSVAVFLEINKAYDTVWTNSLLSKLLKVGVHGNCLNWISDFLRDRSVVIRIGSHTSHQKKISNGVTRGAVISPLLFNIMLYDFPPPI